MIGSVPRRRLRDAAALVAALRAVEQQGSTMIDAAIGARPFIAFDTYPDPHAIDPTSGAQYFFHAHRTDDYDQAGSSAGHIHCFVNPGGKADDRPMHHIVAIDLDRTDRPRQLFTTNAWVTNEDFCPATAMLPLLDSFRFAARNPLSRFVVAAIRLFRPEISGLLSARDETLAARRKLYPRRNPLTDRRLEIISSCPIDLEAILASMRERIRPEKEALLF